MIQSDRTIYSHTVKGVPFIDLLLIRGVDDWLYDLTSEAHRYFIIKLNLPNASPPKPPAPQKHNLLKYIRNSTNILPLPKSNKPKRPLSTLPHIRFLKI